jgi:phosphate starvation-inducible PhoH-like protein
LLYRYGVYLIALIFIITYYKGHILRKRKNASTKKEKIIDLTNKPFIIDENKPSFKNRLKPRTENQKKYIRSIAENTITFCQGSAGSGKTHCAVGLALEYLLDQKVDKIIVTRPVVEAGEKIGYLPGKYEEKLFPYLLPIEDEINYFIGPALNTSLKLNNKIEIVPLGFMRGRNFHNCFIVADECQNASYEQLKMLLTRIGQNSKMVLTGDVSQSDLSRHLQGGFYEMMNNLNNVEAIGISTLTDSDIVRNPIIAKILAKLDIYEQGRK